MNFEIVLEAVLCDEKCTEEEISATFGALMEALVDLGVDDPFIGGSLTTRQIEVALVVGAATEDAAFAKGRAIIAKAFSNAGLELSLSPSPPAGVSWSSTSVRPAV